MWEGGRGGDGGGTEEGGRNDSYEGGGFSKSEGKPNLEDDAGLSKAAWGGLTQDERTAINTHLGRPADYSPTDPSLRDRIFDATNPSYGSAAYQAGIRGMGVNFDGVQAQEATNPGMTQDRMDAVGSVIDRLGMMALGSNPMTKVGLSVARAMDAYDKGMTAKDAALAGAFDAFGGWAAGAINKGVVGALGPDVGRALGQYNSLASLANLGGAGVPTFNPGGMAVKGLAQELGVKSISRPTGATNPDGTSVQGNYSGGGFAGSRGGEATPASAPAQTQTDSTPAAVTPQEQAQINPWAFDGAAFGKRMKSGVNSAFGGR